tara:strand:+ start:395 stop:763 length:369 start_codon:yes stop_codon:yes gene_type:complete
MPGHVNKKAKGGMRYKAKKGSKLGMVSVETGFDNNPEVTRADVIQGAKKKKGEAKGGMKMKDKKARYGMKMKAKKDKKALHGMETSHPQVAMYGMKPKPQMSKMGSKLAPDNNYDMLDKQQS